MKHTSKAAFAVFVTVVALTVLVAAPPNTRRAEAAIDMTGIWNIFVGSGSGGACEHEFEQTGSALEVTVLCGEGGGFTGAIDKATGDFALDGYIVAGGTGIAAAVSGTTDGSTASGTYSSFFQSGEFTAQKKPEAVKPAFSLSAYGPDTMCDGITSMAKGDTFRPETCDVPIDGSFTVTIEVVGYPQPGYEAFRTYLAFGSDLIYKQQAETLDEIIWPECTFPTRTVGPTFVRHYCPSNSFLWSSFTGNIIELQYTCTSSASGNSLDLLPFNDPVAGANGTSFLDLSSGDVIPHVDSLGINCVNLDVLPYPGDTDGDGCSDMDEHRSWLQADQGGARDHLNPYDFYDVAKAGLVAGQDGRVDLFNDVVSVINHYSPQGFPPYDVQYDRGPSTGPNNWNMTAPDGKIDLFNDIIGVVSQAFHDCR